ncbi:MAG: DHH family phosphoesterase [Dorea sp.]|nr:DHH family phosphoesterase [Dorea sp.]
MNKKDDIQLKGRLKFYMNWPIYATALLVAMCIWIYSFDRLAGIFTVAFTVIYLLVVGYLYIYSKSKIVTDLVEFAAQYGIVQNKMLKELKIPYAILTSNGKVLWMNDSFEEVLNVRQAENMFLSRYMPELNRNVFPKNTDEHVEMDVFYEDKEFKATMSRISVGGFNEAEQLMHIPEEQEYFIAVYLRDDTEMNKYIRENEDQKMVIGLLYIDNYDEVIENVEEVRQSLLMALVERRISKYVSKCQGISKRLELDKYLVIVQKKYFREMIEDKFSILEDVKSINVGNNIPVTLSIGLGFGNGSYAQAYSYARVAIDMALARGGDQAVIKNTKGITYYGGKREQTAKNTRVKARVKAEALREFITVKDDIFVMGHKLPDTDALGAAIGIYRAAAVLGKRAHIVINEVSASLRPLYECYKNNPDYPADMFMKSTEALAKADDKSLVVVVDTNRPHMTDCPELLKKTRTIVVLDHHRQNSDKINNALLSYVEPYASSACEMVSEILQYIVDDIKIPKLEACSLYAGIVIDTNNFVNRTGVRTFEAAAFLRRAGADITMVRKLFRDDMDAFRAKADIISTAEVYKEKYCIAVGRNLRVPSPTILGAQAADELLDINNIKASFVLTQYNGRIYVSARSIDEVNVQIMMERIGGGGHINASGAQFEHTDLNAGIRTIKNIIDEMSKKGEI